MNYANSGNCDIMYIPRCVHLITRAKSDEMEELQESWMNKI